jgi:hypothetical protein
MHFGLFFQLLAPIMIKWKIPKILIATLAGATQRMIEMIRGKKIHSVKFSLPKQSYGFFYLGFYA